MFTCYQEVKDFVAKNNHSRYYKNADQELVEVVRRASYYEVRTYHNNDRVNHKVFWKDGTTEEFWTQGNADAE